MAKKENKKHIGVPADSKHTFSFVFGKKNYQIMLLGLLVVILGFVLMYGGTEDIYSFRKITLAPIVVILGLVIEIFAIFFPNESN